MVYLGSAARLQTHFGLLARDQLPNICEDSLNLVGFPYGGTDKGFLAKDSGSRVLKFVKTRVSESTKSHQCTSGPKTGLSVNNLHKQQSCMPFKPSEVLWTREPESKRLGFPGCFAIFIKRLRFPGHFGVPTCEVTHLRHVAAM